MSKVRLMNIVTITIAILVNMSVQIENPAISFSITANQINI